MKRKTAWQIVAIAAVVAIVLLGRHFIPRIEPYLAGPVAWFASHGIWGLVLLAAIHIPAAVLFVPAWPVTWTLGYVFGVARGFVGASLGGTAGALVAFLVSRYLARDYVKARYSQRPMFRALDRAVSENGFKIVGLTRLSPAFPYNMLNYMFGLTEIHFGKYALATWIGMMPGTLLHVYIGSAAKDLADLLNGHVETSPATTALFFVGLVATIAVTVVVTHAARKALREATHSEVS
jgi:uncharacterized membrane protein YdjX (TVP38/TMEM64 family)